MKKSDSLPKKLLYLVPRFILWGICMLYLFVTVIVTLDMSGCLYPLEELRLQRASRK